MKFSIATVFALAAVAFAYPAVDRNAPVKRQNIVTSDPAAPAMSDAQGNAVPFDAVQLDAITKKKRSLSL
ncbi:hypothetical protein QBC38DRAFT_178585 [Podospora fimiseda]|uniref:Uncharacterized protein n=1 Tax=Podospora fimiseda TaxID=252190 RepID=A0AAN7BYR1_9PEZI|nr:hypothetical protein QBC38DRAFT_178585 [Podospora fimiseda]